MSRRWVVCVRCLAVVIGMAAGMPVSPARALEPEELHRGLVAQFLDPDGKDAVALSRLEPTIALAWQTAEAGHPRLHANGGKATWLGRLKVARTGAYRFSVRLRGNFRLSVAGKEALRAEVREARAALHQGPEVMLEAGIHPLSAEFTRFPGAARVELLWKGPGFREEPLSHDVVGHLPAEAPARLKKDIQVEQGRYLAEELSCVKCHQADEDHKVGRTLGARLGPDLSEIGQRVHPGWIERWLESPRMLRPGAVMPEMFAGDELARVERHAVAVYLSSLGGPIKPGPDPLQVKDLPARVKRGQDLFLATGCSACHDEKNPGRKEGEQGYANHPLSGLGSKTTAGLLARYLSDPLKIDPSGRMPHMLLKDGEASDLAWFLCASTDPRIRAGLSPSPSKDQLLTVFTRLDQRPDEKAAFAGLPPQQQVMDLGKRLVIDRGCNNCHTIAPEGKPFATVQAGTDFKELEEKTRHEKGCLAPKKDQRGTVPWFGLSADDRQALQLFLSEGLTGAGSPAPSYSARLDLKRFNCLACHQRDGAGGLTPDLIADLRRSEKEENAEMLTPPPLTGVGHKLRTPWLRQVLTEAGRARPWMGLRMPQFGAGQVGKLPEGLAALEGAEPDDTVHAVKATPETIEIGRLLVGKEAFGCISCHDLAGKPNTGTRGADLASSHERVRYDWYRRWLEQPQRMQPGTRMPTVFTGGKSLVESMLLGNADAQAEAMWAYLSRSRKTPGR